MKFLFLRIIFFNTRKEILYLRATMPYPVFLFLNLDMDNSIRTYGVISFNLLHEVQKSATCLHYEFFVRLVLKVENLDEFLNDRYKS